MKQSLTNLIFFMLYAIPTYTVIYFFFLPQIASSMSVEYENIILSVIIILIALFTWLAILPALICRTGSKLIIFLLCFLLSPTLLGWILLMVWAVSSNNNADRHEDIMDILQSRNY